MAHSAPCMSFRLLLDFRDSFGLAKGRVGSRRICGSCGSAPNKGVRSLFFLDHGLPPPSYLCGMGAEATEIPLEVREFLLRVLLLLPLLLILPIDERRLKLRCCRSGKDIIDCCEELCHV